MNERSLAAAMAPSFWAAAIWAGHFAVIYGFTAWACARGLTRTEWLGAGIVTWVVAAATGLAVVAAASLIARSCRRGRLREFTGWLGAALAVLVLVAVIWEAAPVLLLPPCG
ncbi:MAG TPA: hypothetical protein VM491_03395 [Burkholderiaceae bacterium]|nr:hypothetical protein [Burkholderiaceae bacterium]